MNDTIIKTLLSELDRVIKAAGTLAVANSIAEQPESLIAPIENVNKSLEKATITSRDVLERLWRETEKSQAGAIAKPLMNIAGTVRTMEYDWLHIRLNTLLPHCRFQAPIYLSDTITRLLDMFTAVGGKIPYHRNAMLIIDEHCDIQNRNVYDQDNKGWKAVVFVN